MRSKLATAIALAGSALLVFGPPASGKAGDIYAGDPSASTVVRVDGTSGAQQLFASGAGFVHPDGSSFGRDGTLYVADYSTNAGTGAGSDGAIFKVTPGGAASVLAENDALFNGPTDVVAAHDGFIYGVDPFGGTGGDGLVFRVDPNTGAVTTVSEDPKFAGGPLGIDVLPDGTLVVADQDAGPGFTGAVFRVNPVSGAATVVAQGAPLEEAFHLELGTDQRSVIVGDALGNHVIGVDLATGIQTVLAQNPILNGSLAVDQAPDGRLFAANADDPTIFAISGGVVSTFASGAPLEGPEGIQIEPPRCAGKLATITGSTGADRLSGSPFADVIVTLGGKDTVNAGAGKDLVCGGAGKDLLKGGAGKDTLRGEAGKDKLVGGKGKDKLVGGKGRDNCVGKADKEKAC